MSSKLFEEAIADAKKLKEVAEQNAKNAIIESISPVIKQMIEKEISGFGSVLFEEDESVPTMPLDPVTNPTDEKPPISVSGGKDLDVPMVDDDGKVTVDFEDLFDKSSETGDLPQVAQPENPVDSALTAPVVPPAEPAASPEVPPAAEPPMGEVPPSPEAGATPPVPGAPVAGAPTSPEEEPAPALTEEEESAITYEAFSQKLASLKTRLEESRALSEVGKVYLREQLLNLYGMLEKLAETKKLPQKIVSLNENRLEVLYKKLKESKLTTIYNRSSETKKGQVDMAGLKKMTTKLMEEAEKAKASSAFEQEKKMDVKNPTEKTADKAGKHAMAATKPNVDTSDSSAPGGSDQGVDAMKPEEKFWNEEVARIEAELAEAMMADEEVTEATAVEEEDAVAESASEEEEEETVYEVDEKELAEAVRSLRKESIKRQMKALKEQYEELDEVAEEEEELDECGMGMGMEDEAGMPQMEDEDVVVTVSSDDGAMSVSDPSGDESDLAAHHDPMMGMGDDELDLGGEEGDLDLDSLDLDDEDEMDDEMAVPMASSPMAMKEGKKVAAKKVVATAKKPAAVVESKAVKTLKGQLAEQSLLNAKLIYLNKFLQMENLSRKQKQKIVEYLDNAKTIEEAKEIYGRIKKVLDESVSTRSAVGSSSKTTKSGAATVTEGTSTDSSMISENRWMQLAGIKKRS